MSLKAYEPTEEITRLRDQWITNRKYDDGQPLSEQDKINVSSGFDCGFIIGMQYAEKLLKSKETLDEIEEGKNLDLELKESKETKKSKDKKKKSNNNNNNVVDGGGQH